MSAPTTTPAPTGVGNGPMQIRTLYSGDRLIIDALVVDATWRTFPADQTLLVLDTASEQRVQLQVRGADGTEITTPAGPMALQFWTDIDVGQVSTVAPDQPARVWSTGAPPELVYNFEIPQGLRGIPGQMGPSVQISAGAVNMLPPGSGARADLTGPPTGMILELSIPKGDKGDSGAAAAKVTMKAGVITNGAAGSAPAFALRTDTTDPTGNTYLLDMTVPQGVKGDTGNVTNAAAGGDFTGNFPNPTLNAAAKALFDTAGAATSAVNAHKSATDPHGDRAYADSKINANAASITLLRKYVFGDTTRSSKPYNSIYKNSDYGYLSGSGDIFAQGGWSAYSSCTDPTLVSVGSAGGAYSYFIAPVSGRYFLHYHAVCVVGATSGWLAATITTPDRNIGANTACSDQRYCTANGMAVLDAFCEYYVPAGQKVYWGNWGTVPFVLKSVYNGQNSRITMSWMGLD